MWHVRRRRQPHQPARASRNRLHHPLPRRGARLVAPDQAARFDHRMVGNPDRRSRRPARPGEQHAQPRPDSRNIRRAHDRARARDVRSCARSEPARLGRRRGRADGSGRLRRHLSQRVRRAERRGRSGTHTGARCRCDLERACGRGTRRRGRGIRHRRRSSDRWRTAQVRLDVGLGQLAAPTRNRRRHPPEGLRLRSRAAGRRSVHARHTTRRGNRPRRSRRLRATRSGSAARTCDDLD